MQEPLVPLDEVQVRDIIAWAVAEKAPLEILGGGTKRALGRPIQAARGMTLAALKGIEMYEPSELVMTVAAGTPVADVEAALAANRQRLAFEPPDYSKLLGSRGEGATIGGLFACNLAGPRRLSAGAARDHLLGFRGVNGRGESFKAGGRVVKNVTGFDLCKLVAGSYGTLVVLTRVTFKVLPASEAERTVLILGLDPAAAAAAMIEGVQSAYEISGAAHLPPDVAARSQVASVGGAGRSVTALRVEGPVPSVGHRAAALRRQLGRLGEVMEVERDGSVNLWREIRDVWPFAGDARLVWRLAVPPALGAKVVAAIARETDAQAYYDRGGGCVWLAVPDDTEAAAAVVRRCVDAVGGSATLVRASDTVRAHGDVFPPLTAALRSLTARVKEAFDPLTLLNPGRMYAGL